jgi:hypothetical protein
VFIVVTCIITSKPRKECVKLEQTWLTAPRRETEAVAHADVYVPMFQHTATIEKKINGFINWNPTRNIYKALFFGV